MMNKTPSNEARREFLAGNARKDSPALLPASTAERRWPALGLRAVTLAVLMTSFAYVLLTGPANRPAEEQQVWTLRMELDSIDTVVNALMQNAHLKLTDGRLLTPDQVHAAQRQLSEGRYLLELRQEASRHLGFPANVDLAQAEIVKLQAGMLWMETNSIPTNQVARDAANAPERQEDGSAPML